MVDLTKIKENVSSFLKEQGYILFKLDYSRNNKEGTLSIVVDRDTPISLDDIVNVSEKLSSYLDSIDPFEEPYTLDVSSLGAEKPIDPRKLSSYIGSYVNLHLTHPFKGENILEGTLEGITDGEVSLSFFVKGRKMTATFKEDTVDKARLAIKF